MIVVDDASQDDTAEVAKSLLNALALPGQVLCREVNLGVGQARRLGFSRVQSPLIACMDADDCCEPNRFVDPLKVLRDPSVMLVGGDVRLWADPDESFPDELFKLALKQDGVRVSMPTCADAIAAALVFFCPIYAGVSTFRRSILQCIEAPAAPIGEDWLMVHRLVQTFGVHAVANTGTVLARYRRHTHQLTHTSSLDSSDVLPLWKSILAQALAMDASAAEMALHAKFSPLSFKVTPVPTVLELQRWETWSEKLRAAATDADYVPTAIAAQTDAITHGLRRAYMREIRHLHAQMPEVERYEFDA